jgi:hypothetical protein
MFGAPCMKTANGKAAICLYKNYLVIKPDKETLHELLSWDGVTLFTPSGDRAMNGWVQLGLDLSDKWPELASLAVDFVATLESNTVKKKK